MFFSLVLSLSSSRINAFWSFDGHLNEQNLQYNGISINNISYISPGITGYGSALNLNANFSQYVLINPSVTLNLSMRSFTFEFWINPYSLPTNDRGMIGQCQSMNASRCLHLTLRSGKVRMSFFSNACDGTKILSINTWYHLAFVYDYSRTSQTIYIDGIIECNRTSAPPLQVFNSTFTPMTIGYTSPLAPYYFDGLIDQLSVVEWAKSTSEILNDATLVARYSFENYSYDDTGPNGMNGFGRNITFGSNGILFNENNSYFQSTGFVLLGISNRSYSFSIWIYPFLTNQTTILYVYENSFSVNRWCLSSLNFDSQGRIQAQSRLDSGIINVLGPVISSNVWTHIVQTYSQSNGMSLYINGSFYNRSSTFNYRSSETPLTLRLGNVFDDLNGVCVTRSIGQIERQYQGWMDEFRVYSRELTSTDAQLLSTR